MPKRFQIPLAIIVLLAISVASPLPQAQAWIGMIQQARLCQAIIDGINGGTITFEDLSTSTICACRLITEPDYSELCGPSNTV